jgi:hypothetical protein
MISVEEYLAASYEPDCDYLDGEVVERNWGNLDHSWTQSLLMVYLSRRYENDGIFVFPELRIKDKPIRYRLPGICLTLGFVAYVWVLHPRLRIAYTAAAAECWRELKAGRVSTENPTLEVPLNEIFA